MLVSDHTEQALIKTFFVFNNQMLNPFAKIMQSFIMIQNTKKRDWIGGGKILVALFFKIRPILVNIEGCLKFLD